MRYVKMLALAAVAVGALMAFIGAGTASASKLCSTTADPCPPGQHWPKGTEMHFSLVPETSALLTTTEGETINTCKISTVQLHTTNTGSSTETVTAKITKLVWEGCNFNTTTITTGGLEIHKIAGTSNGTLTADGITEVTINTVIFGSCVYGIKNGASIGDLTEGIFKTGPPVESTSIFHASAVAEKLSGSNLACPATAKWVATYRLTSPENTTLSITNG